MDASHSSCFCSSHAFPEASGTHPLAVVTSASSGIGYHLAERCTRAGMDLIIVANDARINTVATSLSREGTRVEALQADLSRRSGVDKLVAALRGRPVSVLCANVGRGLDRAFLDQPFHLITHVVEANITGTLYLLHHVGRIMRAQGAGRILITASMASSTPGRHQAVYNASKAFLDMFSLALRHEVCGFGVSVTCLILNGSESELLEPDDTYHRRVAKSGKDYLAEVARMGFGAMMRGDSEVDTGWQGKLRAAIANITPGDTLGELHLRTAEPQAESSGF